MEEDGEVLAVLASSLPRRALAVASVGLAGLALIYGAVTANVAPVWQALLAVCGCVALWGAGRLWRATGGRIELTEADANSWIGAVNDLRLALGTMLGVGADLPDRLPATHPHAMHHDVYQWLTVLQEYLVLGLMGKPVR